MPDSNPTPRLSGLKQSIRKEVLGCFSDGQPHEVNDIAASVGVSRQTVMKALHFFLDRELITTVGKGQADSQGGKKPLLYALSPDRYLVCITLWEGAFRINLFNLSGKSIDQISLDIPLPDSATTAMENAGQLATMLLQKNNIELSHVRGVSVSVPGNVDRRRNLLIYSTNAPQWGVDIPLADYIRPYFTEDTFIYIETPSKIHSGVYFMDDRFFHKRLLVISIFYGITGCLIENGHILNGTNSLIGEIGHMIVDPSDHEICNCGSHGCLEVMISLPRLRGIILENRHTCPTSPLLSDPEHLTYQDILDAFEDGDALGEICGNYMIRYLTTMLQNASLTFDPDFVIFAGKYFVGGKKFTQRIYDRLATFRYYPRNRKPFEIMFDPSDLIERDAMGAMMRLRWFVLTDSQLFMDQEDDPIIIVRRTEAS